MVYLWLTQAIVVLLYVVAVPTMPMWLLFLPLLLIFAVGIFRLLIVITVIIAAVVASNTRFKRHP